MQLDGFALTTPSKDSLVLHPDPSQRFTQQGISRKSPDTERRHTNASGPATGPASEPGGRSLTLATGPGSVDQPPQLHSPDGGRLGSLHLQVIRLVVHLEFGEHQRDGVSRVGQDGPLAVPVAVATGAADGADPRGVAAAAAQEVGAGDEAAGAAQGASAGVLRCQSTD